MNESTKKEEFYFKPSLGYIGYFYILMGIVVFVILTTQLGGQALFAPVMFIIVGIVLILRAKKVQLTMYDTYFETSDIKQFYVDIVSMERKKNILVFLFKNDINKKFNLALFDDDSKKIINEKFDKIILENDKGVNNG